MHITLLLWAFTIFTETKMHLVQPPKILHNHCFQFLLGIKAVQTEIEDNGYANLMWGGGGDEVHYGLSENSELCFL